MRTVEIGSVVDPVKKWNPRREGVGAFTYVDISSIDQGAKTVSLPSSVNAAEAPSRARQLIAAGDVLLSTVRPNLNAVAYASPELDGATASTGYCVLRPRPGHLDGRYLFHWVRAVPFIGHLVQRATGASYPAVSDKIVKAAPIPLPSMEEQRRIAAVLDAADALRVKRQQALAKLDDLERAVFFDMFGGTLPTHLTVTLGEFMPAKKTSIDPRKSPDEEFELFSIPAFDVGEPEIIHGRDVGSTKQLLEREDVILSRIVPHIRRAGVVTSTSGRRLIGSGEWIIFRGNRFVPRYLRHVLVSDRFHHSFMRTVAGVGGSLLRARPSQVAEIEIPLPPLEEQQMFASHLRAIDDIRAKICQSAAWVENLFASLQQRAFRGEL